MIVGRLTTWLESGYGFIARDDGRPDIFVHLRCIERSGVDFERLLRGDPVVVEIDADRKGRPRAASLRFVHQGDDDPRAA